MSIRIGRSATVTLNRNVRLNVISEYPSFIVGKTYYVSDSTGNDTNDGLTTSTPWKTLSKVQSALGSGNIVQPGDSVLFKKGDTFSGTLTINRSGLSYAPITIGSYGTGAKPIFSGTGATITHLIYILSKSYIIIDGINIIDTTFPSDPTRLLLARIQRAITLDKCTNCTVQNCDISLVGTGIYTAKGGYHTIDNNTIYNLRMIVNDIGGVNDYGANQLTLDSSNNTIINNLFYGGWAQSYDFGYDGGAIEFFDEGVGCSNNFIAYNTMYDNVGIFETFGVCDNNIIVYNKFINNKRILYTHGTHTGWQFYNNAIIETSAPRGISSYMFGGDSGNNSQIDVKNNIFQIATGTTIYNIVRYNLTRTYNAYKLSGGSTIGVATSTGEFSTSATIFTDTTNIDPSLWNYTPSVGSPLIDAGIDVGLTRDFAGNSVSNPPEIGILEVV